MRPITPRGESPSAFQWFVGGGYGRYFALPGSELLRWGYRERGVVAWEAWSLCAL